MKRLFAPALMAMALASPAAADNRALSGFRGVNAEDRLTIAVSVGEGYSVEVTGSDAARIRTRLADGILRIEDARRPWFGESPRLDAHVRVTAPAIDRIGAARGAQVIANLSDARCTHLSVAAAMGGSATVTGATCNTVSSAASMGAEVRIAGSCRTHDASASMGGYVRAEELACESVDASASMGGNIQAFASRTYNATAAMGGAINVNGGGNASDTTAAMGGSISSTR